MAGAPRRSSEWSADQAIGQRHTPSCPRRKQCASVGLELHAVGAFRWQVRERSGIRWLKKVNTIVINGGDEFAPGTERGLRSEVRHSLSVAAN